MKKIRIAIITLIVLLTASNIFFIYNNIKFNGFARENSFGQLNHSIQSLSNDTRDLYNKWDSSTSEYKTSVINSILIEINNSNIYSKNIKDYYDTFKSRRLNIDTTSIFTAYRKQLEDIKGNMNAETNKASIKELSDHFSEFAKDTESIYNQSMSHDINPDDFIRLLEAFSNKKAK